MPKTAGSIKTNRTIDLILKTAREHGILPCGKNITQPMAVAFLRDLREKEPGRTKMEWINLMSHAFILTEEQRNIIKWELEDEKD